MSDRTSICIAFTLGILLGFCGVCGELCAQTTTVVISDSNGNRTTGTISNGNIYFRDSDGNITQGTIRNGYVYLSSSNGGITLGTIKNGDVSLTDQDGNTTGTVRDGYIFLRNSNGSTTTGTYDASGHIFTTTTPSFQQQQQQLEIEQEQQHVAEERQREAEERQRQIDQQNYEAGQAFGKSIGDAIANGIDNHRITSYCKANPTGVYRTAEGVLIDCPNVPLDSWAQGEVQTYCADNPGSYILFGSERVDCLTPPNPANLKWATWELKGWQFDFSHQRNKAVVANAVNPDQIRSNWEYWEEVFCSLAPAGAGYKDLNGKKQHCER